MLLLKKCLPELLPDLLTEQLPDQSLAFLLHERLPDMLPEHVYQKCCQSEGYQKSYQLPELPETLRTYSLLIYTLVPLSGCSYCCSFASVNSIVRHSEVIFFKEKCFKNSKSK